ncbi:hypothetical protein RWE15_11345 [Virgibacillus halophilus]|uniref:Uncharacterized protein n=1 Tax=Tigheibacillus halophilus TaxID=361280 RepID=A0ABU5C6G1_9BACI|nr:hypothetical protein [Virgibacillus halophilus]
MPDDGWDKYYSFLYNEFGKEKARPNIVSYIKIYALHTTNNLECTIPFYYHHLNIIAYDGTINSPELYVFFKYEDKTNETYEDCFQLVQTGKHIGKFNGPDDVELHFSPVQRENKKIKTKLYEQKNKLESDFPNKPELHYYSL